MPRSFLSVLKNLERSSADGVLPKKADALLRRLIGFVEGGSFTKSETDKFILENFRLSSAEMTKKWNDLHFDRQKEDSTFRGQVSLLGHYLSSLFSVTPDELSEAFLISEAGVLKRMAGLLDAFALGDFDLTERFPAIARGGFLPAYTTDSAYDMKDCSREIQLLKSLDRSVVEEMLSEIDMDKLVYVMQTIREPLVKDMQAEIAGKKKKVRTASVNCGKLEFCRAYGMAKAVQPKPSANREVSAQDLGVSACRTEEVPYNLEFSRALSDILTKRSEERLTGEEAVRWSGMTEAQRDEEKRRLVRFLLAFTKEGFQHLLKRYHPLVVQEVLNGDYPAEQGAVYQFRK